MSRSILLATLALATACMTGPHDGQVWTGGSNLSFNGYLERPNEEVRLVALGSDGVWRQLRTVSPAPSLAIRSAATATRWDEANWYGWSATVAPSVLTPYWRNEGTTGRRIRLKAQTRRSSTAPWTDLYSFRESILSTTSQCSVHTPGRTVSDLEPCLSAVSPVVRIRDSATSTCATSDTRCNGRDEDCDGRVDEDYAPPTPPPFCGRGACFRYGTERCGTGGPVVECTPGPSTGDDTDCDGVDDDCDGRTDEHFVVTQVSCGSGVGVCAQPGTRRCVSGSITTTCEPGGTASDETCNGLDDDCDGSTDESHSACGDQQCVAETACGAGGVPQCRPKKRDDTCDGFDDDCDGEIDEHHGTTDATCDGVDDDCDGSFDENFVDLNPCATETCSGGVLTSTPTLGACPSDPLGSGPPTLPGTSTPFAESLEGLLGDYQTVPSGTAPEAIVPERATRLYGEVHTLTGGPMGGVRVSVLDHPGLGSVLTRADGRFDLVVNGGNVLSVVFERTGHPTVHRTIRTGWNEHVWVPDVVMTPLDTPTSIAGLGSGTSTLQIHRGSAVNDGDGLGIERRATLLIPRETRGTYTRADGSSAPLPATSTLRATEFTVGALGPDAMPATLPSQIMYTYALELSIDEADADGAEQVQFDRVLPFYVENFLGFPTGTAAPMGWYDRVTARWRPSADGIVVAVVGVAAGRAQLDLTGDRVAEDAAALAAYGIDTEELAALAGLYPVGTSLWRVPIEHFTTWDINWPGVPAPGARDPNDPAPDLAGEPESCEVPGSIVQCENRTVAEELPILGTDLSLRYQSDRVPGARHTRRVRFLAIDDGPSGPPPNRIGVEANVEIAGRRISIAVPEPDDEGRAYAEYEWDGLDWRGRPTTRPERALIELCHIYPAQPASPEVAQTVTSVGQTQTFGRWGSIVRAMPEINRQTSTARLCKRGYTDRYFGSMDARSEHGLGGLMLTARDVPSPEGQSLVRGDGTIQTSADAYRIASVLRDRPNGTSISSGVANVDNICLPVVSSHIIDANGRIVIAVDDDDHDYSCDGNGVYRVEADGTFTRIAGTGMSGGYRPEHELQPANSVPLGFVRSLALGPDGSLFIGDQQNGRVFRVRPDGLRETIMGWTSFLSRNASADDATAGEGRPATEVMVNPMDLDVLLDGTLVVYNAQFERVQAVRPDGTVETLIGGAGPAGTFLFASTLAEGSVARGFNLERSEQIAVHPLTGEIYFDVESKIFRRSLDGTLRAVTGSGPTGSPVPGAPTSSLPTNGRIDGMAFDADGSLHFVVHSSNAALKDRVWRIDAQDRLELVAGGGRLTPMFDGVPAADAQILAHGTDLQLAFAPSGDLHVSLAYTDEEGSRARHIARIWRPGRNRGASSLVTREGNVDVFDSLGRHVETRHGITDAVLRTFAYDDQGRLDSIRDAMNNLVDVQYVGNEVRFVAPLGETTRLTLDASGWVREVSYVGDPDFVSGSRGFSRFHFDTSPGREGLLQVYRDRRGQEHHLQHDAWGYLASDLATGSGRSWTLAGGETVREDGQRRRTVTLTSSQGRVRTHEVTHGDVIEHRVIEPDGTVTRSEERLQQGMTSGRTTWASDGSQTITSFTPDPDLGWSAAYPSQSVFRLPSQGTAAGSTDRTVTASSVASIVAEAEDGSPRHRRWTTTTEAGEASSEWERLSDGRSVSRTISAMGRRTVTIYDLLDRPIWSAVVDAAGQPLFHPVTYTYDDGLGRPTRITQAPTDASQRPILTDVERTRTVELDYASAGRLGHVTQPHGDSAFSPADPNERMRTSFGYDAIGRVTSSSSNGAATGFGYDVMGQLTRVTPPGRGDHTMTYSADEQLASYAPPAYTDPDAAPGAPRVATPSTWAPGPDRDEVASYSVTRGAETRSSGQIYDPTKGRLASMTVGGVPGSVTFSYAPRAGETVSDTGQLRHASMPQTRAGSSAVATTLYYDGPLGTETRTEGLPNAPWKVGYHHDAADELRLAQLTVAVGSATRDVPTIAYDYDADGLITSLGYGYDEDGIALREGSYDENVAPNPTIARSMAVVPDPQTGVLAQTCVGGTVALGSGTCSGRVSTTITPNDFGEPASVETTWNGSSVSGSLSFHYVHDRAGRIVARTEVEGASSTTLEYGYDAQGRLENVWRRTSPTTRERVYHYQYDANGNRIGWALASGTCNPTVSTCTRVDEQDRLLSAGGVSYRYDLQGQLATRTEGTRAETFTYDMAGNLRTFVVREGETQTRHVQYAIDAFGRRVGRYVGTSGATSADRFWVYQDGLNPVAQLDASGNLELLFLYGTQAHVPDLVVEVRGAGAADDVVYRVVTDQVGSVRRLVNVETGAVAASFDYSPFGVLEREDGALAARFPFRFAGGLWDGDTGLVRFGARDYDPRVGRWTAKDPILWGGGQGNLYEYCGADPSNYIDLNGRRPGWVRAARRLFGRIIVGGVISHHEAFRILRHKGDVFVEGGLSEAKKLAHKYSSSRRGPGACELDAPHNIENLRDESQRGRGSRHLHAIGPDGDRLPGHIFYNVPFMITQLPSLLGDAIDFDESGAVDWWDVAELFNEGVIPVSAPSSDACRNPPCA